MAEPRVHEPKLAALEAYEGQLLSAAGRSRVEAHLASCTTCREALLGMRRFARIKNDVLSAEAPPIDWTRMELPVRREAARLAGRHRVQRVAPVIGLAVAAAVALFFVQRTRPPDAERASRSVPSSEAARPAVAPLRAQITALIGEVHGKDARGVGHALELDTSPAEGWLLETGLDAELHLALEGTAALILAPGSRLWLRALRPDSVVLELEQGRIINHVRKRSQGQRYEISSAERRVAVRGTRFSVERRGTALSVQVDEGAVAVLDAAGTTLTELAAPARWSEGGARQKGAAAGSALPRPREAAPDVASSALFEAPSWPHVAQWQIDGAELEAHATLRMRLPPGEVQIGALLDDGRRMQATIHVDALGTRFDPRLLRLIGAPPAAEARAKPFDPSSAAAVIHAAEPALQRCYERALKGEPRATATILRLKLRVELDARGHVRRSELLSSGADLPELLRTCVRQLAESWRFQSAGATGITFDAPISFRPAQ